MMCFIQMLTPCTSGIYYDHGKEPPPEGPPKLHLLVESNEEWRVSLLFRFFRLLNGF